MVELSAEGGGSWDGFGKVVGAVAPAFQKSSAPSMNVQNSSSSSNAITFNPIVNVQTNGGTSSNTPSGSSTSSPTASSAYSNEPLGDSMGYLEASYPSDNSVITGMPEGSNWQNYMLLAGLAVGGFILFDKFGG